MKTNRLFNQLCQYKTLLAAWKQVKAKGSAGGIDGVSVEEVDSRIEQVLTGIQDELRSSSWIPQPYLRISIPKKEHERRKLGLLSVKDKIVQQALKQLTEAHFEKLFVKNSYGYRPDKGHTRAIRYTWHCCKQKKCKYALRLDVDNYFDTIDHEVLFKRLGALIADDEVVRLIQLAVKMGVVSKKLHWEENKIGIPQGGVLSPQLANLYLHSFDQFVLSKADDYVRYADDFIIFCHTKEQAEQLLEEAKSFLKERLRLTLNEPCVVETAQGIEFLGILIFPDKLSLSEKKKEDLRDKINQLEWQDRGFTSKGLQSLQGIKCYYAALLPEEYLKWLDDLLLRRLEEIISECWETIPNKSVLSAALKAIEFYSDGNLPQTVRVKNDLVLRYTSLKSEQRKKADKLKNEKFIKKRKAEYRKKENEATELIISTYGTFIGVNNSGISLKTYGKQLPMPPTNNLRHITVLSKGVSISSNAIEYCMQQRIPVDFFTQTGRHAASILSPVFMESTLWKAQADLDENGRALLAKKIISGKLKNQFNLIKYYHKYHKTKYDILCEKYDTIAPKLKGLIDQIGIYVIQSGKDYRMELMALEAAGAVLYWDYVRKLLQDDQVGFIKREHKGATDLVNCLLNYGYSLLYARVWQALLLYKLNPSDGVLHVRQPGKPTFVYDVVELFRAQAVDRVVLSLIQKGESLKMDKGLLTSDTIRLLVQHVTERLNRYEIYRGKECRLCDIINMQIKEICDFIAEGKLYRPYIAKW